MILRSTDTAPEITPISGMAWHYVWELLEFRVFKNGYACHAYANGRHGGIERVTWCLRDVEDAFGYNRGELHARNKDDKAMLYDKRWLEVGGKSEFYFCSAKTAMARFTNSYRKSNLQIGEGIVAHKRAKGIHGVPLPRTYEVTA